jgi:hypothetical protein
MDRDRFLRFIRNESKLMSTEIVGANPAVMQSGAIVPVSGETTLAPVQTGVIVPDWMATEEKDLGTDMMGRYISPSRLKIVQGQSQQEIKQEFGESSVILVPDRKLVTSPIDYKNGRIDPRTQVRESEPIRLIPLFFYPEFLELSPMGVQPFVRNRTTDSSSPLAAKCRGPKDKRTYPCPEDKSKNCIYSEALNFIATVLSPEGIHEPVMLSFRAGSFFVGSQWCRLAKQVPNLPLYAQVFELNISPRKKDAYNWYSWNIRAALTPNNLPEIVTDPAWFNYLKDSYKALRANYESGLLRANYDDDNTEDAEVEIPAGTEGQPKF